MGDKNALVPQLGLILPLNIHLFLTPCFLEAMSSALGKRREATCVYTGEKARLLDEGEIIMLVFNQRLPQKILEKDLDLILILSVNFRTSCY